MKIGIRGRESYALTVIAQHSRYYYDYGKSGENSDGHWDGRVDYGWHLSSKFPRAPKTLDEQ